VIQIYCNHASVVCALYIILCVCVLLFQVFDIAVHLGNLANNFILFSPRTFQFAVNSFEAALTFSRISVLEACRSDK